MHAPLCTLLIRYRRWIEWLQRPHTVGLAILGTENLWLSYTLQVTVGRRGIEPACLGEPRPKRDCSLCKIPSESEIIGRRTVLHDQRRMQIVIRGSKFMMCKRNSNNVPASGVASLRRFDIHNLSGSLGAIGQVGREQFGIRLANERIRKSI